MDKVIGYLRSGKSVSKASREFSIPRTTLHDLYHKFLDTDSVSNLPRSGLMLPQKQITVSLYEMHERTVENLLLILQMNSIRELVKVQSVAIVVIQETTGGLHVKSLSSQRLIRWVGRHM